MAWDRNGSCFRAVGVPVLPVVATRPVDHPTLLFHRPDYVSNLHFAYPLQTDVYARSICVRRVWRVSASEARLAYPDDGTDPLWGCAPLGHFENLSAQHSLVRFSKGE